MAKKKPTKKVVKKTTTKKAARKKAGAKKKPTKKRKAARKAALVQPQTAPEQAQMPEAGEDLSSLDVPSASQSSHEAAEAV